MMSFQIVINPNRRAAARFIAHVRRTLQKALVEEQKERGLTQSDIARMLDIHRSVINRELKGTKDITLGRVAELAWALGRSIEFDLPKPAVAPGVNRTEAAGFVRDHIVRGVTSTLATSAKVTTHIQPVKTEEVHAY